MTQSDWALALRIAELDRPFGKRRRARPFGAEDQQSKTHHDDMHRDRDDQQNQHRSLGQRLVGKPVDHRAQRNDDGQREQHLHRHRQRLQRHVGEERPHHERVKQVP